MKKYKSKFVKPWRNFKVSPVNLRGPNIGGTKEISTDRSQRLNRQNKRQEVRSNKKNKRVTTSSKQ